MDLFPADHASDRLYGQLQIGVFFQLPLCSERDAPLIALGIVAGKRIEQAHAPSWVYHAFLGLQLFCLRIVDLRVILFVCAANEHPSSCDRRHDQHRYGNADDFSRFCVHV